MGWTIFASFGQSTQIDSEMSRAKEQITQALMDVLSLELEGCSPSLFEFKKKKEAKSRGWDESKKEKKKWKEALYSRVERSC